MLLQGLVGPQQFTDGSSPALRFGKGGEAMVSELNGKYYELTYRGKMFNTCTQSAIALSTLSATVTGLCLANPFGSPVNVALMQCHVAIATAPAGVSNMHYEAPALPSAAAFTGVTALTVSNGVVGATNAGYATANRASTVPTAGIAIRALGGGPNATGSVTTPFIVDDIAGGIILSPGTWINLGYLTTAVSVVASFLWAELPL